MITINVDSEMMKEYVTYIKGMVNMNIILLLSKAHLINFYEKCGYTLIGQSDVVHGEETWYELRMDIH